MKKNGCNTDPKQDSFNLPQCVIDSFAHVFFCPYQGAYF